MDVGGQEAFECAQILVGAQQAHDEVGRNCNAASNRSTDSSVVRSSITVPPDLVVGLLGSSDENLRALERLLTADIHARGNAITLSGEPADVALAERAIAELIEIVASGQTLTPDAVRHSVAMLTGTDDESPAEVLDAGHPVAARQDDPAQDA